MGMDQDRSWTNHIIYQSKSVQIWFVHFHAPVCSFPSVLLLGVGVTDVGLRVDPLLPEPVAHRQLEGLDGVHMLGLLGLLVHHVGHEVPGPDLVRPALGVTTVLAPEDPQPRRLALLYDVAENLLLEPVDKLGVAHELHWTRELQRGAAHYSLEGPLLFGIFKNLLGQCSQPEKFNIFNKDGFVLLFVFVLKTD